MKFHKQQILHFRLKGHKPNIFFLCQEEKSQNLTMEIYRFAKKEEEEMKMGFCSVDFHSSIA